MEKDQRQEEIIEDFAIFGDDWDAKFEYLIEFANELPAISTEHKTDNYIIQGCQSRVWIDAQERDGKLYFSADSDAIITKGIIALLIKILNGRTPQEVLDTELYFIDRVGLKEHLSPTRSNGLLAMTKQMRLFALAFASKGQK